MAASSSSASSSAVTEESNVIEPQEKERLQEVLAQRQFNWICSLDEAYIDSFFAMLEAAGRDGKRLIQSRSEFMRRYIQYRYGLLHQTLLRGFQEDSKGEEQGPRQFDAARLKRFGFDQDRNLQAFFPAPSFG
eukprot:gb/GECG01007401.1/.p1 GENE.gb/GECG01007401.1/~~gb/GECG01007401.1/.p1  ORF type:complete len:133 (+),score=19.68 gb/GECG01007401.1/:1-399(+)